MNARDFFDSSSKTLEEWLFACVGPKAKSVDADDIRELIRRGVDVDARDNVGATAFMHAVKLDLGVAALLLEAGADLNVRNEAGYTALGWALNNWNLAGVDFLLEKGIDVNLPEKGGRTAVMAAASKVGCMNGENVLRKVIAAGADLDAADEKGKTAWDYAEAKTKAALILDQAFITRRREVTARTLRQLRRNAPRLKPGRRAAP